MSRAPHVPALDGLRGLAIVLTMLVHFTVVGDGGAGTVFFPLHELGVCGVDLFFVLSGFLITGILVDTKGEARYFRQFYGRRILRIVPLFYLLLVIYCFVLPALSRVFPWANVFPSTEISNPIWYWLFVSNIYIWGRGGFPYEPLSVSWSLAIEEQFYLVWPLIVRFFSVKWLKRIAVAVFFIAFITRIVMMVLGANPTEIYVFTPARLDDFAVGALVAFWVREHKIDDLITRAKPIAVRAAALVAMTFAGNFALATFVPDLGEDAWRVQQAISYSSIAVLFGTFVVFALSAKETGFTRFLTQPWLRRLGLYSYGIYLLNNTVAHALMALGVKPANMGGPFLGQILFYPIAAAGTIALAALSYHAFERRFLNLKNRI